MGRPVILGNGSLTVGLDEQGLVHDFYYPYVGLDNLTTARSMHHKIGVWVDGIFSWIDSVNWQISVDFEPNALVSRIDMTNQKLGLRLMCADFVDNEFNAFCRRITVQSLSGEKRSVRLFMHQVFEISRRGRGDTAMYVPEENYILDYKGRCALLVYAQDGRGNGFDQFAVGNYGIEGKDGTFEDAEDGELSGNAVEHGGVDSVGRLSLEISGEYNASVDYWIVAADSQWDAQKIHDKIKADGLQKRIADTRTWWNDWLNIGNSKLQNLPEGLRVPAKKSLMVIKAHTDARGGVIASCDSSIYNYGRDYYSYVWPRDGALAMWPLIRLGYADEPKKFFEFCRDSMHPGGYMAHKYQPDRAIGSTWHPLIHGKHNELAIQEDETAIVIAMLGEYLDASGDKEFVSSLYTTFIQPMSNFMADFRDESTHLPHASYDLWEEKFLTTTYTTATVYRALITAARLADTFEFPDDAVRWRNVADDIADHTDILFNQEMGSLAKGFLLQDDGALQFDDTLDVSSAYGPMMFAGKAFKTEYISKTLEAIENTLHNQTPSGGTPRYEGDRYFTPENSIRSNPWPVTTMWLAQYYLQTNRYDEAGKIVDWVLDHALPSGVLSEQLNPTTGEPISVTPLVWSHAELISTLLDSQQ